MGARERRRRRSCARRTGRLPAPRRVLCAAAAARVPRRRARRSRGPVGGGLPAVRRATALLALVAVTGCGTSVLEATSTEEEPRPLVVRGCETLYHEAPGQPKLVIVSDLPLEAPVRTAMHQMTQAIKLTLKDRGFRAGRWSVGYVVCDDSGPKGHYSRSRCVANAERAERVRNVVGVIGTLDSACARAELPVLAAAGIVMVGPLNTADDLTHVPGRYARLSASDSAQAAAAAQFIRKSGAKTVAVVSDGSAAGQTYARAFVAHLDGLRAVGGPADAAYVAAGRSWCRRALVRRRSSARWAGAAPTASTSWLRASTRQRRSTRTSRG